MLKHLALLGISFALLSRGEVLCAEALVAARVASPTNTDWVALARAGEAARTNPVEFVWQDYPDVSYAEIRRALWLAALHGITNHVCRDAHTRRLMKEELLRANLRLQTPFDFDIAVRDVPSADELYRNLLKAQAACRFVGSDIETKLPTVLRCQDGEVLNESSGLVFTSIGMAVNFAQASHMDSGFIFENDGSIATNVFIRQFEDNTATVVNLTPKRRYRLSYRKKLTRVTFDLQPNGVTHLLLSDPPRFSHDSKELFVTTLWQVSGDGIPHRIVDTIRLPTAVPESYIGTVRYRTTVFVPTGEETLFLHLDADGAEVTVLLDNDNLGSCAWEPFEWKVPVNARGKRIPLEIRIEKRSLKGSLLSAPIWRRR